jgi:hypothetical protein
MYNVYADSELYHPLERDMLSVQGNGYVVTIIKGLFGTIDYFSFGEDDQFILASEWRYGSGDYLLLDDIYFNAQFSGTSNEEDFSYSFHGFSLWGLFIIGSGEHTHGSNTEPEELTFMGTSSLLFSSLEEQ